MGTPTTKVWKSHETLFTIPVELVLPFIGISNRITVKGFHTEVRLKTNLHRLLPFKNSLVCYGCGKVGEFFAVQRPKNQAGAWELNLYSSGCHLLTCDHLIPKSKGGENHPSNYGTLCQRCNSRKGSLDLEEFLANRNQHNEWLKQREKESATLHGTDSV